MNLFHLEIRNAISEQSADAVIFFKNGHRMSGPRKLLGRRKARRTGADDRHGLAGFCSGRLWHDPALCPSTINDGVLYRLNANGVIVDVEGTGSLAGRRTNTARELRKVIGRMQRLQGMLPILPEDQIIEIRNDVVHRAAVVAKGGAAIHTPRRLDLCLRIV